MQPSSKPTVVIGAGPAGLCAAIELKKAGAPVILMDENAKPGGQLFKQIHKFFGSKEHKAGVRGFDIGNELLTESLQLGIDVRLNTEVVGFGKDQKVWEVENRSRSYIIDADRIIIAAGATENSLSFEGWTLPGVMTAGCAQTLINVHRVLPGKRRSYGRFWQCWRDCRVSVDAGWGRCRSHNRSSAKSGWLWRSYRQN